MQAAIEAGGNRSYAHTGQHLEPVRVAPDSRSRTTTPSCAAVGASGGA
jgi:hypothetical protein